MGTRSTVKFYENGKNILSVYQQHDGYVSGVGKQIADLLKKYQIVNGIPVYEESAVANGVEELALFYIIDNKKGSGNMYATHEDDSQEYNYEIYSDFQGISMIKNIKVYRYEGLEFDGTVEEFINFVG